MLNRFRNIVLAAVLLVVPCIGAQAEDDTAAADNGWEITVAPYLWGTSLDGRVGLNGLPPVDVDASLTDLLEYLNFALSLHTEFRKGKWAFVIDPTYFNLEMELEGPGQNLTGKIESTIWLIEGWASYRVLPSLEVLGGVRWQDQELDPRINGNPVELFSAKESWSDVFVGLRWQKALGQKWMVSLRGDLAAGDSEDISPNLLALFNRRIGKSMALNLGYRYFKNEYDSGNYLWDMEMTGPIIGYTWQFGNVSWPQ